jgi:DNA-binding NtrC family response regulator
MFAAQWGAMSATAINSHHLVQPPPSVRSATAARLLVVDDDREMCEVIEASLLPHGYLVDWRLTPEEAMAELDVSDYAVLLVDVHMGESSGLDLCREALARRPDLLVIVMTGFGTLEHAVGAIRAGAYDFVTKPISMEALQLTLQRAVQDRSLSEELKRLRGRTEDGTLASDLGKSDAMKGVVSMIERVAHSDTNVLISGDSGTGKELVARALHERSGRNGPFLAINCAAVPETLLESELFGHVRGAFTDAHTTRRGLFEEANGGTLLLDEIGEMPLSMQAKLLRALQERKVRPIGSSHEVPFNARIVTATNRDLEAEVAAKTFREDLFYRINVIRIDVPSLRSRGRDVLDLAQLFLDRSAKRMKKSIAQIDPAAAQVLLSYDWPGNVRELENCMERAVALAHFDAITSADLPTKLRDHRPTEVFEVGSSPADLATMDVVEERYIRKVLNAVGGNKTRAAQVLGFDRRTLYRKLKRQN